MPPSSPPRLPCEEENPEPYSLIVIVCSGKIQLQHKASCYRGHGYSNSRVHGNMTLYAEAGSYHYKLLLLNCMVLGFLPRREVEEGNSEALLLLIITTYYYTMLHQLLLRCYFMLYMNCWLFLFSCCKTRQKMLVFDRPSFLPLF